MPTKKQIRQEKVKQRLKKQLGKEKSNTYVNAKGELIQLRPGDIARIEKEINTIDKRLAGEKKKDKRKPLTVEGKQEDKWFIDIYSVNFSRTKRSDRRKNKGKSRKKMRIVKTVSLVKSVVAQPGMIQAYKEGRMGMSPKTHAFKMRKDEPFNL